MKVDQKIVIEDNTLNSSDISVMKYTFHWMGHHHPEKIRTWDDNRTNFVDLVDNEYIDNDVRCQKILKKIEKGAQKNFGENIVIDWAQLTEWQPGCDQFPHLDFAKDETVLTSITNLNTEYTGGRTYIVDDMMFEPKVGRTVYFDGQYYFHGVTKVDSGARYTIVVWYKERA